MEASTTFKKKNYSSFALFLDIERANKKPTQIPGSRRLSLCSCEEAFYDRGSPEIASPEKRTSANIKMRPPMNNPMAQEYKNVIVRSKIDIKTILG